MIHTSCPYCSPRLASPRIKRDGRFFRTSDGCVVQRYRCGKCFKRFSDASRDVCFRQKKRQENIEILKLLSSCCSLRRIAILRNLNRITVERKLIFLGIQSEVSLDQMNKAEPKSPIVVFDELESSIHTKLKPVSVPTVVDANTRRILAVDVASMPAKGHLAKLSRKKYGWRKDERVKVRQSIFRQIRDLITDDAIIRSDQHPHYPEEIRETLPNCRHEAFKSKREKSGGQGELKKGGFDPIFAINHTLAMLRANINRLIRKTWCISKRQDRLKAHLYLYAFFHNSVLIQKNKGAIPLPYH